jgi:hypothetical protein
LVKGLSHDMVICIAFPTNPMVGGLMAQEGGLGFEPLFPKVMMYENLGYCFCHNHSLINPWFLKFLGAPSPLLKHM